MQLNKISDFVWEYPKQGKMRVPARIYGSKTIVDAIDEGVYNQIANVATLPGIVNHAMCMPDGHFGYGFPIGGVAAFDLKEGIISPGGIGFDINCGMRLVTTNLAAKEVKPKIRELVDALFRLVPAGVGSSGFVKLDKAKFRTVTEEGARWAVKEGYGWEEDLKMTEEEGRMETDSSKVSDRAMKRGLSQIGTLGSGNHYLEIQRASEIHDEEMARACGITEKDQIVIMFHCLPGDTPILTEYGYTVPIMQLKEKWRNASVKCMDINSRRLEDTKIIKFFELDACSGVFEIKTKTGRTLTATAEHPVMTPAGMKLMKDVTANEKIAVMPFRGIPYEEPSDEILISEEDIRKIENNDRIINNLKKRGLLPLRASSDKLPILIKLLGFLTGDGWLGKAGSRWSLKFIGTPTDLEKIRNDVEKLGYKATKPYIQACSSSVKYTDGSVRTISSNTNTIVVGSLGLPILFRALGAPFGNKSNVEFDVPAWLFKMPLWTKRLYLAGYFGAEMTKPLIRKNEEYRFGNPSVSMNKNCKLEANALSFLNQIKDLLDEFSIETTGITKHIGVETKAGETTAKFRLKLSSKEANLIGLWSKIGYEYCEIRTVLSCYALEYLSLKDMLVSSNSALTGKNSSAISVTAYKYRQTEYPTFEQFVASHKLGSFTPVIWDQIESKREVSNFNEKVYDFTVAHSDHNFVANGFVTGNCGSRGFGHQIGTDYLEKFLEVMPKYGIDVLDKELACAPFQSKEGQDYFSAMKAGINMSFANRQVILHRIREAFSGVFKKSAEELEMHQVYDVAHNTAKIEEHTVDGKTRKLLIHRKGSTRAFGPNRDEVPVKYRKLGQPVIIGGSMETGSYLLKGTERAMQETFGTTCHGSGRTMSRARAKHLWRGEQLLKDMEKRGIYVRSTSMPGVAEEAGGAYKDIDEVIESVHKAGISTKVVKLLPMGNVKG